jgi:cell fate regulator YaaT (PSP1 superfamily)
MNPISHQQIKEQMKNLEAVNAKYAFDNTRYIAGDKRDPKREQ